MGWESCHLAHKVDASDCRILLHQLGLANFVLLRARLAFAQVCKQATSWADMAGVDPQKICDAAFWKSESMFATHYKLDLVHGARSDFGRRILQLAASSAAESSVRRRLGSARPGGMSSPVGFTIPRVSRTKKFSQ